VLIVVIAARGIPLLPLIIRGELPVSGVPDM
jgi:hypothetical protein